MPNKNGMAQASAMVPEEDHRRAKENTAHGEISEYIRELFRALAENGDYDPNPSEATTREEQVKELIEGGEYPSDWGRRRKEVFRRDDYTCRNCGEKVEIDGTGPGFAHHIVPAENGGTHYLSNLATLCKECHDRAHGPRL